MIRWFEEASRRYGERAASASSAERGMAGARLRDAPSYTHTHDGRYTRTYAARVCIMSYTRVSLNFTWNLLYCDKAASRCTCTIAHSIYVLQCVYARHAQPRIRLTPLSGRA